jgi:hypothetical protein
MQVKMRPVVNVVADKNSRILILEEEVRKLRSELAAKDNLSQLGTDNSSTSALDVEEALQTQLLRNEALITEKEALARYPHIPLVHHKRISVDTVYCDAECEGASVMPAVQHAHWMHSTCIPDKHCFQ